MISHKLQIAMLIAVGLYFLVVFQLLKRKTLNLKYTLLWLASGVVMLVLAVGLHNLPEGMAVGVVAAGAMVKDSGITMLGALALAVANRVLMLEHAVYSVLSPEGFASILWKDAARAGEACGVMKLTAQDLRRGGIVQGVLREPEEGAHTDWEAVFRTVDAALVKELAALEKLKGPALAKQRYEMFRAMGQNMPPARREET